jgi:DNA-binding NtrC family response regulator
MDSGCSFPNIIGHSKAIKETFFLMNQAIETDMDILITGETGTGKELVAREIHDHSLRRDKYLFAINCGAAPKEVLLSELFGHQKGAFNGAIEDKAGVFEVAEGGTVLMDDISSLPLDVQPNLLAILKDRKVQRMGENTLRDVNMRVIAISNRDMPREMKTGRFREDLYDRLSRFHIHLPPLRQRLDDIPLLAEHFYRQACSQMLIASDGFAPGVMDMLQRYPWPGNVRELRNGIRQACMLVQHGKRIQRHHFSSQINEK